MHRSREELLLDNQQLVRKIDSLEYEINNLHQLITLKDALLEEISKLANEPIIPNAATHHAVDKISNKIATLQYENLEYQTEEQISRQISKEIDLIVKGSQQEFCKELAKLQVQHDKNLEEIKR